MKVPCSSRVVGVFAILLMLFSASSASTPSTSNEEKFQNLFQKRDENILGTLPQESNEQVTEWILPDRHRTLMQDASSTRSLLRSSNKQFKIPHSSLEHRRLPSTGHVWDSCYQSEDKVTANVYNNTDYDDEHDPACYCAFEKQFQSYLLHCRLGNVNCNNSTGACSQTEEIFTFAENTGDLKRKFTCNFCTDIQGVNCTGITETCTFTEFDENDNPTVCGLQQFQDDGTAPVCESCEICQDDFGKNGVRYDCFGQDTNGQCDTSGTSHVHNLVPSLEPGKTPVGGKFGEICRNNEETALYTKTDYDDEYSKVCDCDDPSAGVIVCDLFRPDYLIAKAGLGVFECFANQCTEISEVYYFSKDTGDMEQKTSCNFLNGLCSTVRFENGKPDSCTMLNLLSFNATQCSSCSICEDASGQYGVTYDCYGVTQDTCYTAGGNAVNNLVDPIARPPTPGPVGVGTNPTAPTTTTFFPTSSPVNVIPEPVSQSIAAVEKEDQNLLLTILGASAGAVLLAVIFAAFHKRGCSTSPSNSKAIEVDIEVEDAEPQPAIDENNSPIAIT